MVDQRLAVVSESPEIHTPERSQTAIYLLIHNFARFGKCTKYEFRLLRILREGERAILKIFWGTKYMFAHIHVLREGYSNDLKGLKTGGL